MNKMPCKTKGLFSFMPQTQAAPKTMIKSLDLFSGIGGLTHALHGIAEPVAYCDIEPEARAVTQEVHAKQG